MLFQKDDSLCPFPFQCRVGFNPIQHIKVFSFTKHQNFITHAKGIVNLVFLSAHNRVIMVYIFSHTAPGVSVCYRVTVGDDLCFMAYRHINFKISDIPGKHQHFFCVNGLLIHLDLQGGKRK